jgi:hypothetical protein
LVDCGLCDDDQTICLMAYREKKEIFKINNVKKWYDGLKCFGGEHLTVRTEKEEKNRSYRIYKERARYYLLDGKYSLAKKYYKMYLKEKINIKMKRK